MSVLAQDFTRWVGQMTRAERVLTRWHTAGMDITCDWRAPK